MSWPSSSMTACARCTWSSENIFYYLSVMNENYLQPAMPAGVETGILKGAYMLKEGSRGKLRATLLGSGTILREVLAAAELLENDYKIPADVYSVTSFSELRREALLVERENLLHPERAPQVPFVQQLFGGHTLPVIAATDNMRLVPDQIRQWIPGRYVTLGTDGFGRSDGRSALRGHFEVDRRFIVLAALKALADEGSIDRSVLGEAVQSPGHRSGQGQSAEHLGRARLSQLIEVRVPDMGNFTEVGVIDVLVKAGDRVEIDTPLITLETEKATMDVPSTAAGVVEAVHVTKGGKVSRWLAGCLRAWRGCGAAARRSGCGIRTCRSVAGCAECCRARGCSRATQHGRAGARHGQLHGSGRGRGAGQARRQGRSRHAAGYAGDREGDDGCAVDCRGCRGGSPCHQGRQDFRRWKSGDAQWCSRAGRFGSRATCSRRCRTCPRSAPARGSSIPASAARASRACPRPSTRPDSARPMRALRCASSHANWAWTWAA